MIISTDEYDFTIEKAPDSPYYEVSSSGDNLELFLNALELCGTNPYQDFPPKKTTTGSLLILPEVLSLWFSFEVLNFGV